MAIRLLKTELIPGLSDGVPPPVHAAYAVCNLLAPSTWMVLTDAEVAKAGV